MMLRTLGRCAVLIAATSVLIQYWYPRVPPHSEEEILQERMQAYDVVVIGAGLAGLSAVLQASLDGAHKLMLVDKEPKLGGNSAKASSGINALDDEMDNTFASDTTVGPFFCPTIHCSRLLIDDVFHRPLLVNSLALISLILSLVNRGMRFHSSTRLVSTSPRNVSLEGIHLHAPTAIRLGPTSALR